MRSGVYEIRNANGKRYIGSAVHLSQRWGSHRHQLRRNTHHSAHLQSAWNKSGEAAFNFYKLVICKPEHLLMYEQLCIDGFAPEYNICRTAGSSLGVKRTPGCRANLSASKRGNKYALGFKHSAESRAKLSASLRGKQNALGYKHSASALAKMSATHLGRKRPTFSDEHKAKISAALLGRKLTPETIAKMSAAKKQWWRRLRGSLE